MYKMLQMRNVKSQAPLKWFRVFKSARSKARWAVIAHWRMMQCMNHWRECWTHRWPEIYVQPNSVPALHRCSNPKVLVSSGDDWSALRNEIRCSDQPQFHLTTTMHCTRTLKDPSWNVFGGSPSHLDSLSNKWRVHLHLLLLTWYRVQLRIWSSSTTCRESLLYHLARIERAIWKAVSRLKWRSIIGTHFQNLSSMELSARWNTLK